MPLLHETTPKREHLPSTRDAMKVESKENSLTAPYPPVAFPPFPNSAMFTPSQLIMASQLMAASGLTISNPAFFHPGLLPGLGWQPSSPPSPPTSSEQLSPTIRKSTTINNNNNVVSSSTATEILRKRKWSKQVTTRHHEEDVPVVPLTSPTSSVSPPSSGDISVKDPLNKDKQFTCGVCNRSFGYKHVLQNHERTHTGEKPFECPECHKRFTRDHHLKTHMRLHTGERPYHCEHCDRQFVQVANLRRHLRVHTGERPYNCDHCSAKFSDSNQLKAHVLIHTNEKPFSCDKCSSRFRRRHHLVHHKCGVSETSSVTSGIDHDEIEEDIPRKRMLHPATSPLIPYPQHVAALPEQTEPEDLSMSTGMTSNSSGVGSPLSRSPSSREEDDEDIVIDIHDTRSTYYQRRSLSR